MREFQVRHQVRNFLYSKGFAIVLIVMIAVVGRATWGVFQKERESSANAIQAVRELERLENRKNLIQNEIGRLETDAGIEEEIRTKYNVSRPGEQFFIIVSSNPTTTPTTTPEASWWQKVTGFFK